MLIQELDTPAVIIDLDVMEDNLTRLAGYCRSRGLNLRPHTKTHKIPELAKKQIAAGANGITVSKLGEAEVMIESGISDVLLAYPVVGAPKAQRLAGLAERARLTVSLDSEQSAKDISDRAAERGVSIGILVEIDVGFKRCGLSDPAAALSLAQRISDLPGLEFKGLMFYPGQFVLPAEQHPPLLNEVNDVLDAHLTEFANHDLPVPVVSGGSTPTAYTSHQFHGVTEIRPGMYLFNDRNMLGINTAALEQCALSVLVTVVSTGVPGRAIIDGGSKTFSSDRYLAGDYRGFGVVKEDHQLILDALSEEHGFLGTSRAARCYRVGERLTVIPNHVCTTINMHNEVYGVRGDRVETIWKVQARGLVR